MSNDMYFENAYFVIGTSYAGKSTMVKELAKKHGGIACEENYHDNYPGELDKEEFPCLTYTRDLVDWHDFIRRTPQEYKDWIDGAKKECGILELRMLPDICSQGKPVFVDTNISIEKLKTIAPLDHTVVLLSDPKISISRFFDRPDPEKQFLYKLMLEEPEPEKALENYRKGLELICSQESYDELLNSGFKVIFRDENRSIEQTLALVEEAMGL
ncbi:MAG: AAA family ATPase [Saccharofermentans sp.]|nr:AAA family ATPase [Saccharofermentans sp.]